jgi:hypothetical protein
MRIKGIVLVIFVVGVVLAGCRKQEEKRAIREPVYPTPPVEDLEGFYAYAVGSDGYCIVDLYREEVVQRSKAVKPRGPSCLSEDGAYLYAGIENGAVVIDLVKGRITETIHLQGAPERMLSNPRSNEAFALDSQKKLTMLGPSGAVTSMEIAGVPTAGLVTPDGARVVVSVLSAPRSFVEVVDWLLKNVVRTIDVVDVREIAVAPYGVRMYLLSGSTCFVYDGRSYEKICEINFPSPPGGICMTPAGNKIYFLSNSRIYVVSRAKNVIMSQIAVPGELLDMEFSPDGGWAYFTAMNPNGFFILDAAMDSVVFSKETADNSLNLALSPEGSKAYLVSSSDSLLTFDVAKREFSKALFLGVGASRLLVNRLRLSMEKEVEVSEPQVTVTEGLRQGFTIQVSSSSDLSSAEALAGKLRTAGYPAYVSSSDTPDGVAWYRVRAGLFDAREDADVVSRAISSSQGMKCWVTATTLNTAILPELPPAGRDMNSDGKPEAAYKVSPRSIVVYRLDRGVYVKVYETENEDDIYLGEPRLLDIDGEGQEEAVTDLLEEGRVSVIEFAEGAYTERFASR